MSSFVNRENKSSLQGDSEDKIRRKAAGRVMTENRRQEGILLVGKVEHIPVLEVKGSTYEIFENFVLSKSRTSLPRMGTVLFMHSFITFAELLI